MDSTLVWASQSNAMTEAQERMRKAMTAVNEAVTELLHSVDPLWGTAEQWRAPVLQEIISQSLRVYQMQNALDRFMEDETKRVVHPLPSFTQGD